MISFMFGKFSTKKSNSKDSPKLLHQLVTTLYYKYKIHQSLPDNNQVEFQRFHEFDCNFQEYEPTGQ